MGGKGLRWIYGPTAFIIHHWLLVGTGRFFFPISAIGFLGVGSGGERDPAALLFRESSFLIELPELNEFIRRRGEWRLGPCYDNEIEMKIAKDFFYLFNWFERFGGVTGSKREIL